jgi:hypothetical protein
MSRPLIGYSAHQLRHVSVIEPMPDPDDLTSVPA